MPESQKFQQTPSQTVGPFFHNALKYTGDAQLVPPHAPGSIRLHGVVFDGDGVPVPDAMVEVWQYDQDGNVVREQGSLNRDSYTFTGFGRSSTTMAGGYSFSTVKPGAQTGRAPFVVLAVFARGILHHLFTRAYFSDENTANEADPFLASIDADRRSTLVATQDGESSYRFDIRLQGENETVFLEFV